MLIGILVLLMYCYGLYIGSSYIKIAVISLGIFVFVSLLKSFQYKKIILPAGYGAFIAAYAIIILNSIVTNSYSLTALIAYLLLFVIVPIGVVNAWSHMSIEKCASILVFVAFFIGLISIADYLFGLVHILTSGTGISRAKPPTATIMGMSRLYSVASEPTILALGLVVMVPIQLWWWKYCRVNLALSAFIIVPSWIALILTFSAAGLVELCVALIVILISGSTADKLRRLSSIFCLFVLIFLIFSHFGVVSGVVDVIHNKLTFNNSGSAQVRLARWINALSHAVSRPLLGYGLGKPLPSTGGSAINWYLNFFYQCGGVALIAATVGLSGPLRRNLAKLRKPGKSYVKSVSDWHVACLASWCACLVYLFTGSIIQNPIIWLIFGLGYAGTRTIGSQSMGSEVLYSKNTAISRHCNPNHDQ